MSDSVEAWITWGALTMGVYKATGTIVNLHKTQWFRPDEIVGGRYQIGPKDYHLAEADALAKVRKMVKSEVRRLARVTKALKAVDAAAKAGALPMANIR